MSQPLHGNLGLISQTESKVTYTPVQGFLGTDSFTYNANDGKTDSNDSGIVSINIQDPQLLSNKPPLPKAGPDQTVKSGATITLNGSGSTDPNNDQLKFKWTPPARVTLSPGNTVAKPTFIAPPVDSITKYNFQLIVNDGKADRLFSR